MYRKGLPTLLLVSCLMSSFNAQAYTELNCFDNNLIAVCSAPDLGFKGLYLGAYGGYAWGNIRFHTDTGEFTPTSYFICTQDVTSVAASGTGKTKPNSGIGGVQFGYNWQYCHLVTGLAVDFGSIHLRESLKAENVPYPCVPTAQYFFEAKENTNWLLTAKARLGFSPGCRMQLYATGGLAAMRLRLSNPFSDNNVSLGIGGSRIEKTKEGWVAGVGADFAINHCWFIEGEYLYVDVDSLRTSSNVHCQAAFCAGTKISPLDTTVRLSANVIKLSLNYRF